MPARLLLIGFALTVSACASAPRPVLDRAQGSGSRHTPGGPGAGTVAERAVFWCLADEYR